MKMRFPQFFLTTIVSVLSPLAMASSGLTFVGGEAGYAPHPMPSTMARQQVLDELVRWQRDPVTTDGWMEVHGDAGWVYVGSRSTTTRRQVVAELAQWRRNPVSFEGWKEVGGEAGWVYVGNPQPAAQQLTAKTR